MLDDKKTPKRIAKHETIFKDTAPEDNQVEQSYEQEIKGRKGCYVDI